jgi:hypothetical protein
MLQILSCYVTYNTAQSYKLFLSCVVKYLEHTKKCQNEVTHLDTICLIGYANFLYVQWTVFDNSGKVSSQMYTSLIYRNIPFLRFVIVGLMGSSVMWTCRHIPMFRGNILRPEDGDGMFLRNVGIYVQVHTALQSKRPTMSSSPPWEPQIW